MPGYTSIDSLKNLQQDDDHRQEGSSKCQVGFVRVVIGFSAITAHAKSGLLVEDRLSFSFIQWSAQHHLHLTLIHPSSCRDVGSSYGFRAAKNRVLSNEF